MISFRARVFRFFARQYFRRVTPERDIGEMRQAFEDVTRRLGTPDNVTVRHASIAGVECDWLVPEGSKKTPVLLYLHGGAYVMGSSKTHRQMVGTIAKAAGIRALLPNYRLAPEHPFPEGIDDACAVYKQLLQQGVAPEDIVIAGDSAGGGLTVATALKLRHDGVQLPAALVLLSPWLDLSASGESVESRAKLDPLFRAEDMPTVAEFYCSAAAVREPLVSPVFANVSGLPPAFIQVGDHEILLSDSTRFADKLTAAGINVTLQVWPDMWHVFQFFGSKMPESEAALVDIARFLRRTLRVAPA